VNCVFAGNQATDGSAGGLQGGEVHGCTFADNYASELGGGASNVYPVTNSIFWGNTDGSSTTAEREQIAKEFYCTDDEVSATYSCIQGLNIYANTGNISSDPSFSVFRLSAGSPCIETGTITGNFPDDALDFDRDGSTTGTGGEPAPDLDVNDHRVFGAAIDMGAYEVTFINPSCQSDCVDDDFLEPGDGDVGGADLGVLLNNWGPCAPPCCRK